MTEHGPKLHSTLGASGCYRWWECPGSVRLTANVKDEGSEYAAEGTAAHALGERCLRNGYQAARFKGEWINADTEEFFIPGASGKPDKPGRWFQVTDEMIEAVQLYLDIVRKDYEAGDELMVEQRFSLDQLNPPAPMFGTADAVIYKPGSRKLVVFDLKYGAGVPVEAKTGDGPGTVGVNKQALYYGVGATMALPKDKDVVEIEVVIVQPRAPHRDGPVRRATVGAYDLLEWAADLVDAARRTQEPDAPLAAGSWCKFCGAAGTCPELRKSSVEAAKLEFSGDLSELTPDEIVSILDKAEEIENWIKAVRAHAYATLEKGQSLPGWKLVPKRATRKWADEDADDTVDALKLLGLTDDQLFVRKLNTPAKIEKLLDKEDRKALEALTVKESSGTTMARDTDGRPGVKKSASDDFTD